VARLATELLRAPCTAALSAALRAAASAAALAASCSLKLQPGGTELSAACCSASLLLQSSSTVRAKSRRAEEEAEEEAVEEEEALPELAGLACRLKGSGQPSAPGSCSSESAGSSRGREAKMQCSLQALTQPGRASARLSLGRLSSPAAASTSVGGSRALRAALARAALAAMVTAEPASGPAPPAAAAAAAAAAPALCLALLLAKQCRAQLLRATASALGSLSAGGPEAEAEGGTSLQAA
jgi:hypothetical protein